MTFGLSAFAWTSAAHDLPESAFDTARIAGYDSLELPLFAPEDLPVSRLRQSLHASGLGCTACCILPKTVHPLSPETSVRRDAHRYLALCIETAVELGATVLAGPILAPIGLQPGHRPTQDEFTWAVEALHSLTSLLDRTGITVAVEPVNRAETWFLRTAAEAAALVDAVAHPRVGVTLDTFHANIEEHYVAGAIRELGPRLRHLHASENDRGLLGSGHVDFPAILAALQEGGYTGSVTVEGFGYDPGQLNAPGYLWADPRVSPERLATQGIAYLQSLQC